jgi:hypothetical protein
MDPRITLFVCLALTAQPPANSEKASGGVLRPDPAWKELGRSLWYDPQGKRAILKARVVLREGVLEHLICAKGTKEHEAILATDAPAQRIHAALLLTGAEPGHPVRFLPQLEPPAGTRIALELIWRADGQERRSDARRWVWDEKAKAPLAIDWVFAGSLIYQDPVTKKSIYAAEEGDLVTVANFASAILDLPMVSSANDAERVFAAHTAEIPPKGTEVFVAMSPRQVPSSQKSVGDVKRKP